ncbi:MAG: hypothetical protein ABT940_01770 [Alphaproteobacteria bacterium]
MSVRRVAVPTVAVFQLIVTSCAPAPFIDHENTGSMRLSRDLPDHVMVCYNSSSSSPAEVITLAQEECGRAGKKAKFLRQTYFQCRLLTPTRAEFTCVETGERAESSGQGAVAWSGKAEKRSAGR